MTLPGFDGVMLSSLYRVSDARSRSISPENPTGEPGKGARAVPDGAHPASDLGQGWKVRPSIVLPGKSITTLADVTGPGRITHIWLTCAESAYDTCILRFYWDGEAEPSVEVPLGLFFAIAFGTRYNVQSLPVVVNPSGGMNCYWPMPFRSHCRITVENRSGDPVRHFFYQISYELTEIPGDAAYFHAQARRTQTRVERPEHVILDGVTGAGHYVGTFLSWIQHVKGWWGEGEVKFFLDGDGEFPTICGTGTEDYAGGAWCFGDTYSTPFLGYPFTRADGDGTWKHAMYRWHIPDPIRFKRDIRVTLQALGWYDTGKYRPLEDVITSVAYWYQLEPHRPLADFSMVRT